MAALQKLAIGSGRTNNSKKIPLSARPPSMRNTSRRERLELREKAELPKMKEKRTSLEPKKANQSGASMNMFEFGKALQC